jgi:hypothetical protein
LGRSGLDTHRRPGSSLFAAQLIAHSAGQRSHQAFLTSSTGIAGTLDLAIQHEQDLAVSEASYLAANPDTTQP